MYWHAKAFIKIKDSPSEQYELKADSCCVKYTYYSCMNQWQEDYFRITWSQKMAGSLVLAVMHFALARHDGKFGFQPSKC